MSTPEVRGWCPGAHRPMMSGDGLVVRVRPRLARLSAAQVAGLCAASEQHGNGTLDLTNRANLQLRGVAENAHKPLLRELAALDLLDSKPGLESRRNILVQPLYRDGDLTCRLARSLMNRLADLPDLPAKFGFAIDTGKTRCLVRNSADIRLERGATGGLILRADGMATGRAISEDNAIGGALELARWFAGHMSPGIRRMAMLCRARTLPDSWTGADPAPEGPPLTPGTTRIGPVYGAAFGQLPAGPLARLMRKSQATAMRVTPGRLILLESAAPIPTTDFVMRADDPLLTTDACAGAPLCPQAQAATRDIARRLADRVSGSLHVSGCAKGCARPGPAHITLVGRNGRFDLVKDGCTGDEPAQRDMTPDDLLRMTDLS